VIPVVVRYSARPGHEQDLEDMVRRHWNTLHRERLTTERPAVVVKVDRQPGVFIELFEWASEEAVRTAHDRPSVRDLWDARKRPGRLSPGMGRT
jgi:quinol monooxygenase YgiN